MNPAKADAGPAAAEVLAIRGLGKTFPGVIALDDVSLSLAPGRVHAVIGQNGAGKSTLINILSGMQQPDAGEIRVDGRPVAIRDTRHALELGIATVYQELSLLPNLTVAQNIALGREPRHLGTARPPSDAGECARRSRPAGPRAGSGHAGAAPFARRAADGGDRQGSCRPSQGAGPRRADGPVGGRRMRAALPVGRPVEGARRRHPLCLAPFRGDPQDLRRGHRPAQRPPYRDDGACGLVRGAPHRGDDRRQGCPISPAAAPGRANEASRLRALLGQARPQRLVRGQARRDPGLDRPAGRRPERDRAAARRRPRG